MSIEIGGIPSGAESMQELFETDGDIIAANSWNIEASKEVIESNEATCGAGCMCANCAPLYYYS